MRSIHTILPLGVALACLIGACLIGSGSAGAPGFADAPPDGEPIVLNVYAAASLTETFAELEEIFESDHPGVDVRFNFAGSQDLVAQIAQGAPADVLATANEVLVNIVVNEVVAVLKVLAFRNTIGRNQDVNFRPAVRHQHIAVL